MIAQNLCNKLISIALHYSEKSSENKIVDSFFVWSWNIIHGEEYGIVFYLLAK